MKRLFILSAAALLGWTASANAWGLCHGHGCECKPVPEPCCDECTDACCKGHHLLGCSGRAQTILCDLTSGDCCVRIRAAKRLGHRWNGHFCCDCDLLPGLVRALLCDPCWEVRRAAAWSIAMQGARTELGVVALYISSKLDHHFMVRDRAAEALDILTLCRKECYKELYKTADEVIKKLKEDKVRPGSDKCDAILCSLPSFHGGHFSEGASIIQGPMDGHVIQGAPGGGMVQYPAHPQFIEGAPVGGMTQYPAHPQIIQAP
jgi:hypothetical protein